MSAGRALPFALGSSIFGQKLDLFSRQQPSPAAFAITSPLPGAIAPAPAADLFGYRPVTVASAPGEAEPTVDQLVKMVEGGDATLSGSKEKKDDEAETYTEADEINQEELQMIKARTMYEMVEDLSDGKGKLLFLTNPQAD